MQPSHSTAHLKRVVFGFSLLSIAADPVSAAKPTALPSALHLIERDGGSYTTVDRRVLTPSASSAPVTGGMTNGDFSNGLNGWTVLESGGGANPGQVLPDNGQALMLEGDSFLVTLQQTFEVSDSAESLSFDLIVDPGFDQTDDYDLFGGGGGGWH